MNYKYIILDFGNVLFEPPTGNWNITEKFLEVFDISLIDKDSFEKARLKYSNILSRKVENLEQEYQMFFDFYDSILNEINYPGYDKNMAHVVAHDRTYNVHKYLMYDNVLDELKKLSQKYTLIMLSDNWPCAIDILKTYKIYDYFDKIYISSIYGVEKKDKVFFDLPIKDFHIQSGEALFIDDSEFNLDIAKEKNLDVLLMDRGKKVINSKYKIINNLFDL